MWQRKKSKLVPDGGEGQIPGEEGGGGRGSVVRPKKVLHAISLKLTPPPKKKKNTVAQ